MTSPYGETSLYQNWVRQQNKQGFDGQDEPVFAGTDGLIKQQKKNRSAKTNPDLALAQSQLYERLGKSNRAQHWRSAFEKTGGEWRDLSDDELREFMPAIAANSGKKTNRALEMFERGYLGDKAEERTDKAQGIVTGAREDYLGSPIRAEVIDKIMSNLNNPGPITDEIQSMIEAGISSGAADARENFYGAFRDDVSRRGLPWLSGPAITGAAGFEGDLGTAVMDSTRDSRVDRIFKNQDYRDRQMAAAAKFLGMDTDQTTRFTGMEADIQRGMPTTFTPGMYADYADYLSELEYADAVKDAGEGDFFADYGLPIVNTALKGYSTFSGDGETTEEGT